MSNWLKKRRVMHRYDMTAGMYDTLYGDEQAAKIVAALRNVKTRFLGQVLDVGCGTGILLDYVAHRSSSVVGLDMSKKTLLQAKKRVLSQNLTNVHLVQADADEIPFDNDVYDHVFAMTVVQNTPNPDVTLKEIRRVTKDNAVFVITGLKKIFTEQKFEEILGRAHLKVEALEDNALQCYVAVCSDSAQNSKTF